MPCSNDWFRIRVRGLTETLKLSLRIKTGILVGPRAFQLFNWNIGFRTLSTNEFNEELVRKFLKFFLHWGMVLDLLGPIFVKKC